MERRAPARADVLADYAREVLAVVPRGRVLVGVDGLSGAGKTTFARDLADVLTSSGVVSAVVSLDDFQSPRALRGDPPSARSWYEHGFDHALLRSRVVEPYRRGEATALVGRRIGTDEVVPSPPVLVPPERAVLVVEGIFLHRPELVGLWHTSAWLHVPLETAFHRCVDRDGWDPAEDGLLTTTFFAAERRYLREVDPRRRAGAVFDTTDGGRPRRVFDDSC